ncbi:MAG: TrkA family potassium uptake protein [Clostridiales bacterium]|nr:TrkA family potassium uptake protein [Clostridiales bacterium]
MNILVIGCGKVGSQLASMLSEEGHDVSVIDRDAKNFEMLDDNFSGMTTVGVPIDQDVLKQAGIESCDAVAAVSQDDNLNIMCSQLAREIFKVPSVLARIYDPAREDVFSHFGLHTVCPTNLTVSAVKSALTENQSIRTINFGAHTLAFNLIQVPDELVGKRASKASDKIADKDIFAVIHDNFDISLTIKEDVILQKNDMLITVTIMD